MLNEIKEAELYRFIPEDERNFDKYACLLKYDTLIPKLGGIRRPLTVIARKVMFEGKAPGEYPDENDLVRALTAIMQWCKYPSGKIDKAIRAISELESIDLSAITEEDACRIRAAREAFDQLGFFGNKQISFRGAAKFKEDVLNYGILQKAEKALAARDADGSSDFMPEAEEQAVIGFFSGTLLSELTPESICLGLNRDPSDYAGVISAADRLISDGVIIGWYIVRPEKHQEAKSTDICWRKRHSVFLSKYNFDELSRAGEKTGPVSGEGYLYKYIDGLFCKHIRSGLPDLSEYFDEETAEHRKLYAEYLTCRNEDERFAVLMKLVDISSFNKNNLFYPFLSAKSRLRNGSLYEFKKFSLYDFKNDSNRISYEKILADAFHAGRLQNYALIVRNGWENLLVKETESKVSALGKSWPERIMKYISVYLQQQEQYKKETGSRDAEWIVMNHQEIANWFTGDSAINQIHEMLNQVFYRRDSSKIKWTVLERRNDEALLLSNSVLSFSPYLKKNDKNCTVRKHLDSSLEKMLFSEAELKKISVHKIPCADDPDSAKKSKMFLLSADEFEKYKSVIPKEYDISDIAEFLGRKYPDKNRGWLLRSGDNGSRAQSADDKGNISSNDKSLVSAVRPAIWIKLSESEDPQAGDVIGFGRSDTLEPAFEREQIGKNAVKIRVNPDVACLFEIMPMDEIRSVIMNSDCRGLAGKTVFEDTCCCSCSSYLSENGEVLIADVINPLSTVEEAVNGISDFVYFEKGKSKIIGKNGQYSVYHSGKAPKKPGDKSKKAGRPKTKYDFSVSRLENEYYMNGFRVEISLPGDEESRYLFDQFAPMFIRALSNTADSTFRMIAGSDGNGDPLGAHCINTPDDFIFADARKNKE